MTELEKLRAGLEFCFTDPEVDALKLTAVKLCQKLNVTDVTDYETREKIIRELFGSAGQNPVVLPVFNCDNGKNIHVGDNFLANYNVTILDIVSVTIGNNVMIAPHTLITTIGHPLSPAKRRKSIGVTAPVSIGDDVWIGANVTILPGVTIGNNVVIAAGAVVTKNVPDNSLFGGVPAKFIKTIPNDVE
ncbi:MAG: sugar O-acetyltransferase [Selenomonadaceae bacterium]|nr:sugar O-acetyltransferase [Selenomonadaceae bacterium]